MIINKTLKDVLTDTEYDRYVPRKEHEAILVSAVLCTLPGLPVYGVEIKPENDLLYVSRQQAEKLFRAEYSYRESNLPYDKFIDHKLNSGVVLPVVLIDKIRDFATNLR